MRQLGGVVRKKLKQGPANLWEIAQAREDICFGVGESTLGLVLVALSAGGAVAISLGDEVAELVEELRAAFPAAEISRQDRECRDVVAQVVAYMENPSVKLEVPLDIRGTDFQKRVWQAVRKVPLGTTSTYSDIARKIGRPKAIRAVGSACAKSNFAVVIPCHRVLHKDGSLSGGYYGTTGRQRVMLEREAGLRQKPRSGRGK
ncbi:hypothetical protein BH09VER1_BH09VER1_31010 [soil metagenome]